MNTQRYDKTTCANPNRIEDEHYKGKGDTRMLSATVPEERITRSSGKRAERAEEHRRKFKGAYRGNS